MSSSPSTESISSSNSNLTTPTTPIMSSPLTTSLRDAPLAPTSTTTSNSHQIQSSTSSTPSLNEMADILIQKLDRSKIFPPHLNDPEALMNLSRRSDERPPRPPNGFLLCRKNVHREAKINGICNMRVISKVSGMLWRSATPDEKEQYEKLAIQVHNLHSEKYPNYKYRPNNTTTVSADLSYHHHPYNKLPTSAFSSYGLPSPPYSNISTPTLTATLPYFHPNHHHPHPHHYSGHHSIINHHSLSHHSLNNASGQHQSHHHQLGHHAPLPHLPHFSHLHNQQQQQFKNITNHHATAVAANSSSAHNHFNNNHNQHSAANLFSPISSSSSPPSNVSTTNTTATSSSSSSTNETLCNFPIMNDLEFSQFSPEQIEIFVNYFNQQS